MLITRFNKLIRSRILWGAIAVVISVSFLGAGVASRGSCNRNNARAGVEGVLDGEDIGWREFADARMYALSLQPPRDLSEEANEALRKETWNRLASLRAARRLGITVSDSEVLGMISRDPSFTANGVFDKARYEALVQTQLRVPVPTFESYLAQEIVLQKLNQTLRSFCWTTPDELGKRMRNLTDEIEVAYVEVPRGDMKVADVSPEEARAYYDNNTAQFERPERVRVNYVSFPISNYLADVEVPAEQVEEYYEDRLYMYTSTDTNGVSTTQTLDQVRGDITADLQRKLAEELATDKATDFVVAVAPDRFGNAMPFDEVAKAQGLEIRTTDLFSAYDTLPGVDAGLDFNRTAFDLDEDDSDGYFSDAVPGENHVYVMAIVERQKARLPAFDEIAAEVTPLASSNAAERAFLESVAETRDALADSMQAGKSFIEAAQAASMTVSTTGVFSVYTAGPGDFEYSDVIVPEVVTLPEGEITAPLATENGAILACITTRTPGDPATMQALRPQIRSALERYRGALVMQDWRRQLMDSVELQDFRAQATAQADEEEDEEEADE